MFFLFTECNICNEVFKTVHQLNFHAEKHANMDRKLGSTHENICEEHLLMDGFDDELNSTMKQKQTTESVNDLNASD